MKLAVLAGLVLLLETSILIFGCVQPQVTPTPTPTAIASPTVEASPNGIPSATSQASPTVAPTTLPKNLSETEFVSLCDSYATSVEKQDCLQTAALKFSDPALCVGIKSFDQKVLCSAVAGLDSVKCKQIADNDTKNDCYNEVAIASRDETLCNKIDVYYKYAIYSKMDCLASIAFYKSSAQICETGFTGELARFKPVCLALATENEKECEKTSDELVKSDCYRSLAVALLDGNYCLRVNSVAERAVCFSRVTQAQYLRG